MRSSLKRCEIKSSRKSVTPKIKNRKIRAKTWKSNVTSKVGVRCALCFHHATTWRILCCRSNLHSRINHRLRAHHGLFRQGLTTIWISRTTVYLSRPRGPSKTSKSKLKRRETLSRKAQLLCRDRSAAAPPNEASLITHRTSVLLRMRGMRWSRSTMGTTQASPI